MVIDFNTIKTDIASSEKIIPNFLSEFTELLSNLKIVFEGRKNEVCSYSTVSYHVTRMKEFVVKCGGFQAVKLLAEYEKYAAIGDSASCRKLEQNILDELKVFKECWLSMLS